MSTIPEFDPLDPNSVPASEQKVSTSVGDEELASQEGMLLDPFPVSDAVPSANQENGTTSTESQSRFWEGPPLTEDSVLRAIASACLPPEPAHSVQVEAEKPTKAPIDWLRPFEEIRQESKLRGRYAIEPTVPALYGNLADTNWLTMRSLKPVHGFPEEGPIEPALVEDKELKAEGSVSPGMSIDVVPSVEPATSAAIAQDESQTTHQFPDAELGDPGTVIQVASPDTAEPVEPASSSAADTGEPHPTQPPHEEAPSLSEMPVDPSLTPPAQGEPAVDATNPEPGTLLTILEVPDPAEASVGRPLFHSFYKPKSDIRQPARIPHLGHVTLLLALATIGLLGSGLLTRSALYFHLWGISTVQNAVTDVHYTVGSMATLYLITFGTALLIFPLLWHKGFFAALQWNAPATMRRVWPLLAAAFVCFALAMVDELLLPGPTNAPIDKLFDSRASAWLLFAFGVTFAPFFEEIIFRGFLLPALCTAFDWSTEKATGNPARPLDENGSPQWSSGAMIFASITTSVPFAYMHAEQTAYSLGPFLLLVAVSLVLCWARLSTRSLAASVVVHAGYNFLLFSLMLLGTGGFQHLDKM